MRDSFDGADLISYPKFSSAPVLRYIRIEWTRLTVLRYIRIEWARLTVRILSTATHLFHTPAASCCIHYYVIFM